VSFAVDASRSPLSQRSIVLLLWIRISGPSAIVTTTPPSPAGGAFGATGAAPAIAACSRIVGSTAGGGSASFSCFFGFPSGRSEKTTRPPSALCTRVPMSIVGAASRLCALFAAVSGSSISMRGTLTFNAKRPASPAAPFRPGFAVT
jgi:hypothetical protein